MNIREYLKRHKLLCDGAFGTYFNSMGMDMLPERANIEAPDTVRAIHSEYIKNGAKLIRTNTFASCRKVLNCNEDELKANLLSALDCAKSASEGRAFIACDIGPDCMEDVYFIADTFIETGADIILFETLAGIEHILPVIRHIKSRNKDVFIITQFCVNQYGYTEEGISASSIIRLCAENDDIDAAGFNCGVGPAHLLNILKGISLPEDKFITALPNASYPSVVQDRTVYLDNINYFSDVMSKIADYADIVGGCCGTNPKHIKALKDNIDFSAGHIGSKSKQSALKPSENIKEDSRRGAFFKGNEGRKLIAVELDPPKDGNISALMETANYLKTKNVDVITFADSPSGRTRADSVLMSIKVANETGLKVMPHICCRDKNAIAIGSHVLGAYINDIRNFLVITGDPVPNTSRDNVKGVFNFDSVRLMQYLNTMNEESFSSDRLCYGGAINYARSNTELEIERIRQKTAAGAEFFLTQPVYDDKDIETLEYIRHNMDRPMLVGIMPLVSLKNANFIKNELTGINVPDWVIKRFSQDMSKEEARLAGIKIAEETMKKTESFADGYYFVIPFNRLATAKALIK